MELSAVHPANRITTGTKTAGIKDQTFLAVTIILFRTIGFEDRSALNSGLYHAIVARVETLGDESLVVTRDSMWQGSQEISARLEDWRR